MTRCKECHKPVIETETDEYKAARRPSHWCVCGIRATQRLADKYPQEFASGYDNEHEWKQKYVHTNTHVQPPSHKQIRVTSD